MTLSVEIIKELNKNLETKIYITMLVITWKTWNELKCPIITDCLNVWYIHTMNYYIAILNVVKQHFMKWQSVSNLLSGEKSIWQVSLYGVIPFCKNRTCKKAFVYTDSCIPLYGEKV